ncbi:MAG: hypothetical protein KIH01_09530, partial [Candidatus Freyarchaeota archaeon]|nr:hypothetical protein [Candidatus Jordarchaeia archaeon]
MWLFGYWVYSSLRVDVFIIVWVFIGRPVWALLPEELIGALKGEAIRNASKGDASFVTCSTC